MTDALTTAVTAVAGVNILLAAALAFAYARIYARTRAPFTLGLVLFALAFVAQNALVAYSYGTMMPLFAGALLPYLLAIALFEALGLAAILWTTTR